MESKPIIIGYWKVRGKGHMVRMLLQYLHIPYQDIYYESPESFFKQEHQIAHMAHNLPYLKDGDTIVFDLMPCFVYITQKYNNNQVMGKTIKDQAIIDMFDWDVQYLFKKLLSSSFWKLTKQEMINLQHKVLKGNVEPFLQKCQEQLSTTNSKWYLGYVSIIDFHLYCMINYIQLLFKQTLEAYPLIKQLTKSVKTIPQMIQLQNKPKVKQLKFFPTEICRSIKTQSKN